MDEPTACLDFPALPLAPDDQALFQAAAMWSDAALRMRCLQFGIPTAVSIGCVKAILRGPADDPFWRIEMSTETAGEFPGATELLTSSALLFALARHMREVEQAQEMSAFIRQAAEAKAALHPATQENAQ